MPPHSYVTNSDFYNNRSNCDCNYQTTVIFAVIEILMLLSLSVAQTSVCFDIPFVNNFILGEKYPNFTSNAYVYIYTHIKQTKNCIPIIVVKINNLNFEK